MKHPSEKNNSERRDPGTVDSAEYKLSLFMLNTDESFILVDRNFKILNFNQQFSKLYKKYFGVEVVQGNSILDYVLPERRDSLIKVYHNVFGGKTESTELEFNFNDTTVIIQSKFKPAYNENGEIIGAFVNSTDISSFRKIENEKNEALKQIEFDNRNFRALIDSSSDMIWSLDNSLKLITYNSAFEKYVLRISGKKPCSGDDLKNYIPDIDRGKKFIDFCKRALNGESFTIRDHQTATLPYWTEVSFNPIPDSNSGKISGIACISRDISERKVADKKIRLSKSRLNQAQKIARLGNWNYDYITEQLSMSDEIYRIFDIEKVNLKEVIPELMKRVHPDDKNTVKQSIDRAIDKLEDFQIYFRLLKPDGVVLNLYTENVFEKSGNGTVTGIYGIVQDVSERVQRETELQKFLHLTQKQNEWLNNFAFIVSHNIRSNNNNIKSLAELLSESNDEELERTHILEMLRTSTSKLDQTIQNLSEFIKVQNNSDKHFKKLNLREEIDKTCSAVNQLITESGSNIINRVSDDIYVPVIPAYLESILLNLMTNAIKYRSADRPLNLKFDAKRSEPYIRLIVEDNGSGLDLSKHGSDVFGLFKTFHNNKDAEGFGLFMTKNQIELMNGNIEIQSAPAQGTTFIIHFNEQN